MKKLPALFFIFVIFWSCQNTKPKKKIEIDHSKTQPIFIKLGLYPSFNQPGEILINFNEKYILFYNASPYSYEELWRSEYNQNIPEKQNNLYFENHYTIVPYHSKLSDDQINPIIQKINSLSEKDYQFDPNFMMLDGMCYYFQILFSDHTFREINPLNYPNKNQFELSKMIIDLVEENSLNEANDQVLNTFKDYQKGLEKRYNEE
ncbi:hypothetical protein [Moheibacter lacus]|uniref:Uncharacterized protein n=1 Tax=Moheibacter lacus TaxID=2745851 RepID=A0A838ZJF8_9FLAO|nr:hypothetical protein [Moheibacter lacus]MBA5628494.1 hypothetical protein [Moheibacter lacus]